MIIPNKEIHTLHILDDVYVNDLAFLNCYGVQKIIIGKNVKNINYSTFSFESSIVEEVKVLDDNFKLIDKCLYNKDMTELLLFYNCHQEEYTFPSTMKELNQVHIIDWLKKVTIPKEVIKINNQTFRYAPYLEEVIFEEGSKLEYIGDGAFEMCLALEEIKIPNSVTYIGQYAFGLHYDAKIYIEHFEVPSSWDKSWNYYNIEVVLKDKKKLSFDIEKVNIKEDSPAKDAIVAYLKIIEFFFNNKEIEYFDSYLLVLAFELYGRFLVFEDINILLQGEEFIKDLSSYFNPLIKEFGKSFESLLSILADDNKYVIYLTLVGILNIFYFINDDDKALSYTMQNMPLYNSVEEKLGEKIDAYDELYDNYIDEIEKYITFITKSEERPELSSGVNTIRRSKGY